MENIQFRTQLSHAVHHAHAVTAIHFPIPYAALDIPKKTCAVL